MANTIAVRLANAYSIHKETAADPNGGTEPMDIHITGFDEDGNAVCPIFHVPLAPGVRMALNEGRLQQVQNTEVDAEQAKLDELKARKRAERAAAPPTQTVTLSLEELTTQLAAARREGSGQPPEQAESDRTTIAALKTRLDALEAQQSNGGRKGGRGATSTDGAPDPSALANPDGTPAGV